MEIDVLSQLKKDGQYYYEDIKRITKNNIEEMEVIFEKIALEKPILVVFGNCQSIYIVRILQQTDYIAQNYNIVVFPFIQNLKSEKTTGFDEKIMKNISVFIYQNVSIENKFSPLFATDEHILPLLNNDVKKCAIPFVYFNGYFPQYIPNERNYKDKTPYGDSILQTLLEAGTDINECEVRIRDLQLFTKKEVENNVKNSLLELEDREKKCDVVISDFIKDKYKIQKLFYTPSHPTTFVLVELVKRILPVIGIHDFHIDTSGLPENEGNEMLIYDSVRKHLALAFEQKKYRFSMLIEKEREDIKEYIEKYKKYNFPELKSEIESGFRTINISHMLAINDSLVTERKPKNLTLCGKIVHLSLYLNLYGGGVIARIPNRYAPKRGFISVASVVGESGGNYPITIDMEGNIILTCSSDCKNKIIVIDTMWGMK